MYVRPYHWECEDGVSISGGLQIRGWCLDRDNNPCLLRIEDFYASCYIQLPLTSSHGYCINWNSSSALEVYNQIKYKLGNDRSLYAYSSAHFVTSRTLYYFQPPPGNSIEEVQYKIRNGQTGVTPFLVLFFRTHECCKRMNSIANHTYYLDGNPFPIACWETEINPRIKLLAYANISHCSWLDCSNAMLVNEQYKISTLDREYIIKWRDIKPISNDICGLWTTKPLIMGFDIESYSDNHRKFVRKLNYKHVSYMISCVFYREGGAPIRPGHDGSREKWCILYGDCDDVPGVNIIRVNSEVKMIQEFAELIRRYDPDVIESYNGLNFDWDYLTTRLALYDCKWGVVGRLKGRELEIKRNEWTSQAYNKNSIDDLSTLWGRINIDLMLVVKRDHKLPTYKLNYVANKFLGDSKRDISPKQMFQYYELMVRSKRDPSLKSDAMRTMAEVVDYCVQDTELCIDLHIHFNLWIGLTEMANIVCVNMRELNERGQQVRCLHQLYIECYTQGVVMDIKPLIDTPFVGGNVRDSLKGKWPRVLCIDFNSLYPSIIKEYNICYTTAIRDEHRHLFMDKNGKDIEDMVWTKTILCDKETDPEANPDKVGPISAAPKGYYTYRYVNQKCKKGILPTLVAKLINERRAVQKQIKDYWLAVKEGKPLPFDKSYVDVLDKRQLGLKISANSFFGFTGVRKGGMRPFLQLAVCITSWGREGINNCDDYLEREYQAKIIYGDTDSSFVTLPKQITHSSQCKEWITIICDKLTSLFNGEIVMKEEYCGMLISLMKKKYAVLKYDDEGNYILDKATGKYQLDVKGLITVRRDGCSWASDVFGEVLYMAATDIAYITVVQYVVEQITCLINGGVPDEQFIITMTMGSNYKQKHNKIKLFGEALSKAGKPIEPGERLEYVVIDKPDEKYLGNMFMLYEDYIDSQNGDNPPKLNYLYYLEKNLETHVDKLISACYPQEIAYLSPSLKYKGKRKRLFTDIGNLVEQIMVRIRSGDQFADIPYLIEAEMINFDPNKDYVEMTAQIELKAKQEQERMRQQEQERMRQQEQERMRQQEQERMRQQQYGVAQHTVTNYSPHCVPNVISNNLRPVPRMVQTLVYNDQTIAPILSKQINNGNGQTVYYIS